MGVGSFFNIFTVVGNLRLNRDSKDYMLVWFSAKCFTLCVLSPFLKKRERKLAWRGLGGLESLCYMLKRRAGILLCALSNFFYHF